MRTTTILTAFLLVPLIFAPAHATLVIDVGSANLLPDDTGTLDVLIYSDVPAGELLNLLNFTLRITPAAGTTSTLEFVNPQTNAYHLNPNLDPKYVLFGNSAGPLRFVSSVSQPNDTLIAGDFTADFADVTVTSSRLLARLEVNHQFPAGVDPASTLGHSFTIDVVPSANTLFWDSSSTSHSYTITSGTVNITSGTANIVPEPASLAIWSTFGILGLIVLRRRREGSLSRV